MINHPLVLHTRVRAHVPACPCTGRSFDVTVGVVTQLDKRDNKYWYFVNGRWISEAWVIEVLGG
jgi:hypothetical protein